jgi:hypothetical protein
MTPDELKIKFKFDTGRDVSEIEVYARMGSRGDVIIDGAWLPDYFIKQVRSNMVMLPDVEYIEWLERNLCEKLTEQKR